MWIQAFAAMVGAFVGASATVLALSCMDSQTVVTTVFQCETCNREFEIPGDLQPEEVAEMIRAHFAVEHENG